MTPAVFPAVPQVHGEPRADLLPLGADRESSRAAGFAEGFAAGARAAGRLAETARRRAAAERDAAERAAQVRLEEALVVLADAARVARERTAPVLAASEHTLHTRALELARAVLGVELRDGATSSAAALARVRAAALGTRDVTVRLNPDDLALLPGTPGLPDGVVLVGDPDLGRGEAIAEHAAGWLDGRIDEALRRARAALEGTP